MMAWRTKQAALSGIAIVLLMLLPSLGHALGVLYAGVGGGSTISLHMKYCHATVEIFGQVAVTRVDQVFANDSHRVLEGIYVFPLPERATVTDLVLWINGVPTANEILEREQARRDYDEIVRRQVDPALLEYMGDNVFKVSIFPIPEMGERRVEIEYVELLEYDFGTVDYRFPLNARDLGLKPVESIILSCALSSQRPMMSVESPSHPELTRVEVHDPKSVTVLFGDENALPDRDFRLRTTLAQDEIGLNVLAHTPPDSLGEDGYYLVWVTPPEQIGEEEILDKSVVFLLDVSSSMEGVRIEQAQDALRRSIDQLAPGDRFNVVAFGTDAVAFREDLVSATEESRAAARAFVDGTAARGLTNIDQALVKALEHSFLETTANIVILLTDGRPTYGEIDPEEILRTFRAESQGVVRVFTAGIGEDIDRSLLIRLSRENRGYPIFIEDNEAIQETVAGLFDRISRPVLSDLALDFGGVTTYDTYPETMPDLFAGTQVVQVGRYRDPDAFTLTLEGRVGGESKTFAYPAVFPEEGGFPVVSRIWASKKIAYLLEQIEILGEQRELKDAVKALGLAYQIVTPYTSMLVTEPEFDRSTGGTIDGSFVAEENETLSLGGKTFTHRDGVWVDAAFTPETPLVEVVFGGEAYLDMLRKRPDLEPYLLMGENLLFVSDGVGYRITAGAGGACCLLGRSFPNPFNAGTSIPYLVSGRLPTHISLNVHDVRGALVRTLHDRIQVPGRYVAAWDGTDRRGRTVSSGVYFCALKAAGEVQVRRMVFVK